MRGPSRTSGSKASGTASKVTIAAARDDAAFAEARHLFRQYAAAPEVAICVQDFDRELERLPTMYGPPTGCVLVARDGGAAVGCVGVRRRADHVCEMRRLYVIPAARGRDVGRRLAVSAIDTAARLGYRTMALETLPSMQAAQALYRSLGFRVTVGSTPADGVTRMELDLERAGNAQNRASGLRRTRSRST